MHKETPGKAASSGRHRWKRGVGGERKAARRCWRGGRLVEGSALTMSAVCTGRQGRGGEVVGTWRVERAWRRQCGGGLVVGTGQ